MDKPKLLYIEDDPAQAEVLMGWLQEHYSIQHYASGEQLFSDEAFEHPEMVILDWELKGVMTGLDILQAYRVRYGSDTPIMFITQKDEEIDVVSAFESGADDYMVKPVRKFELNARLDAMSRRATTANVKEGKSISFANIEFFLQDERAEMDGKRVELSHKEYHVAKLLFENKNKIVSREMLLRDVWNTSADINTRTVDVHVSKVRRLFNINPGMGFRIKTIYNHGYRFEEMSDS